LAFKTRHLEITYLESQPTLVVKTVLDQASRSIGESQLTVPTLPAEPKGDLKAGRALSSLDHTESKTELNTQVSAGASGPYAPQSETASPMAASGGTGTGSEVGQGSASSAIVNYNDVFSVSNVTTRPQILARIGSSIWRSFSVRDRAEGNFSFRSRRDHLCTPSQKYLHQRF
jgi:hypothetical protein